MENLLQNFLSDKIKMYVCGPTVYSDSHIGHARCYMVVDFIQRIMRDLMDKKIFLVMNITDIDKKIINRSLKENVQWAEISKKYENSFFASMDKLAVQKPNVVIRVSEVVPQIILYIQKIMDNGFAYPTDDGSIYFDSMAYEKAGYHFGRGIENEEYKSDIDVKILLQKKNKRDFALWKGRPKTDIGFVAEFNHEQKNISTYGIPGWHIECSCMVDQTIGSHLDIHFGGIDLKFPHHQNEMIQANAYYHPLYHPSQNEQNRNKYISWCGEFMHIGHVCVNGKKMSKSLGNYITINDALKEINANQLRWMFLSHKWYDPFEYSDETIFHAKTYDTTVLNFFNRTTNYPFEKYHIKYNEKEIQLENYFNNTKNSIIETLCLFELEISAKSIIELINRTHHYINLETPNEHLMNKINQWLLYILGLLGFSYRVTTHSQDKNIMDVLIGTRTSIRHLTRDKELPTETKNKLFTLLDIERNIKLKEIGIILTDTKESSAWHSITL